MGSQRHQNVFDGMSLRPDSKAANRWHTTGIGGYVAAGVGGSITGRGAHILLIDDPVKDREEADSETIQRRNWKWYTSTAYTRLMPGGAVILIQTRWNENDLAGKLLENQANGGDQWDVLELPAIDENNEALWPEWYPLQNLEQIKTVIGKRDWEALYQQNPTPEEGSYFQRKHIRRYDIRPKDLRIYGASDYAVTEGGGDFTEHGVFGVDENDDIYVLDWWRGQEDALVWINNYCRLVKSWKPVMWAEEKGQIIRAVGGYLKKKIIEEKAYTYRVGFSSGADKEARAQSIRGRMSEGKVYFPPTPWADEIIEQLIKFPTGKYDDAVDVMSLLGRMLGETMSARVKEEVKKDPLGTGPRFNELMNLVKKRRMA